MTENNVKRMFDKKGLIVLLSTIALTVMYWWLALWYANDLPFSKDLVVFDAVFSPLVGNDPWLDFWQYIYQFGLTVLLFLVIPWLIVKTYFKEDFKEYGMGWGNKRRGIALSIPLAFVLLVVSYFASQDPILQSEYPLSKLIGTSWMIFILYECAYFFYFVAYEAMMRGYLQWGLKRENMTGSELVLILTIQTVITTLFHVGKPTSEILLALVMGPVLGYAALKLDSIWYGTILHFLINVFNDLFILYWLGMLPS